MIVYFLTHSFVETNISVKCVGYILLTHSFVETNISVKCVGYIIMVKDKEKKLH